MRKSDIRGMSQLLLALTLIGCATPQKPDPVADYCSALTTKLRQCIDAFENGRPDLPTMDSCLHASDQLESKMRAAADSLPDKSASQEAIYEINGSVFAYLMFLVYTPPSKQAYSELDQRDHPERVFEICDDLVAKRN